MKSVMIAERHKNEYLMHKYWSRKPANILKHYINTLTNKDEIVLDPFCGSGVFIREASKIGRKAIGIDSNPIAILITKLLNEDIDIPKFEAEANLLLDKLEKKSEKLFNSKIRYVVHEIIVSCSSCKKKVSFNEAKKIGRIYKCPECDNKLRFNLENIIDTKIMGLKYFNGDFVDTKNQLEKEHLKSSENLDFKGNYSIPFLENRRILAFDGMETKNLFTKRNFSILSSLADDIHKIKDESIKNALLLLLTSSSAQCSRLIAYRNAMSTGGPSWSVPGYWIPPRHLEMNPVHYLKNRLNKIIKGLKHSDEYNIKYRPKVYLNDSRVTLEDIKEEYKGKVSLVFLDPPYGDNIPYLEFSNMWNGFLNKDLNFSSDISVSDRLDEKNRWEEYNEALYEIVEKSSDLLKEDGKILITFNNNDIKAWSSLLEALQKNKLTCKYVNYQIPAVISSKAQMAKSGSYISDIYSIYQKQSNFKYNKDIKQLKENLFKISSVRKNKVEENLVKRTIFLSFIEHNIDVSMLEEALELIETLFYKEGNYLILEEGINSEILLEDMIRKIAINRIKESTEIHWNTLYVEIAESLIEYGLVPPEKVSMIISDLINIDKKSMCTLNNTKQLHMF